MGRYDDWGEQADEEEERMTWDLDDNGDDYDDYDDDTDADGIGDDGMG